MGQVLDQDHPEALARAHEVIADGGVLLYPTETVFGLGCDPFRAGASAAIHGIKGTAIDRPHLVITDDMARVVDWIATTSGTSDQLVSAARRWPVTVLLPAAAAAPPHLVGPSGAVAVRQTPHPFCRSLIARCGHPLTSTSANRTGNPPPASFGSVDPAILDLADLVVSGAPGSGLPSTILGTNRDGIVVIREGSTSGSELTDILT